jgi:hypothetical protein
VGEVWWGFEVFLRGCVVGCTGGELVYCKVGVEYRYLRIQGGLQVDLAHLLQQEVEQVLHILWRLVAWRQF